MKHLFAVMIAASVLSMCLGCAPSTAQLPAVQGEGTRTRQTSAPQPAKSVAPPHELVVSGPITLEQQLDIVALRAGVIVTLPADVDTVVQKGQLMAGLDSRQLEADRNTAKFRVESLEADLKNWQSELQVRETDMRRAEAMHKEGITTQEAYDHSRYEVAASQFEVERQRGEMLSAKANLQSIDLELEKTKFVAPFKGVVAQRYVRLGQYVTTGDKLFRVMGASPLEVRFTLPGAEAALLKRGEVVTVSSTPEFQQTTDATVTHVSPVVDPGSGTIEVTAVLKNRLPGLIPGTVASVRIAR
ncbi:efflux RND transporter periplasmic adaptor subunit [Tunturibacter empetritectus]|uniref:RND family efflux transporter MFP subunit n=1 Tax=Tunturiibacter lichenicola TaxID=2051959 RepID=A0A7W8J719_9BACT|nr:efflux RND transporter periplasmic adaptor subunit [Edaphobacter lichenicola]MBB5343794.1 RND family efflux transporter MFP subunit [Edaphobacter lichenicola]